MVNGLILVVDNDPQLRATIAAALEDCGCRVATAPNGLAALHAIAKEEPSVVLLDVQMPVLDGIGFAERLREFGRHPGIIVMSGWPVAREELDAIGATSYMPKPFDWMSSSASSTSRSTPPFPGPRELACAAGATAWGPDASYIAGRVPSANGVTA
jgi:CheY-like chemotaxis protein